MVGIFNFLMRKLFESNPTYKGVNMTGPRSNGNRLRNVKPEWFLVNSGKLAKQNKYFFSPPSDDVIRQVGPNELVQVLVSASGERVGLPIDAESLDILVISKLSDDVFEGLISTSSILFDELCSGSSIQFESCHIIRTTRTDEIESVAARYSKKCMVSKQILSGEAPVGMIFREAAGCEDDSGWRMFSGYEDREYLSDINNYSVVTLATVLSADDSYVSLLNDIEPVRYRRKSGEAKFSLVEKAKILPINR